MRTTRGLALAPLALAVLLLSGCSGGGSATSTDYSGGGIAPDQSVAEDGAAVSDSASTERDIITTGQLDLVVDEPIAAADSAVDIVEQAGGRVDASTRQPAGEFQNAFATITARIPADRLDATIGALAELGELRSSTTQANDVTGQTTDLDARIQSLTAAVERLRGLLAGATSTGDLIDIETALSEREAELESLVAQREYLSDQVEYSTLSISLFSPDDAPTAGPSDFWSAIAVGFAGLLTTIGAVIIAFGTALPWLIFIALVSALVLGIVRFVRRRRRPGRAATTSSTSTASSPSPHATASQPEQNRDDHSI